MSFLAGRGAAKEGAYFLQESKHAVSRILNDPNKSKDKAKAAATATATQGIPSPDVLPEVLKHSLPSKIFYSPSQNSPSSFSDASKWALKTHPGNASGVSTDALNPLRAYASLPQRLTFGRRRWELPQSDATVLASTANDSRQHMHAPPNPDQLKAAAAALSRVGSALAISTAIVFGGASFIIMMTASKLELHSVDDIRTKGKDLVQPKFETFRERVIPLRTWVEKTSKKWHMETDESTKEKPLIKELSRTLGVKTSS